MHTTNSQGDKFAFLYRTDNTFDLISVQNVLTTKYGYSIYEDSGTPGNYSIEGSNFLNEFKLFAQSVEAHSAVGDTINSDPTKKNTVIIFLVGNADSSGLIDSGSLPLISWIMLKTALSGTFGPGMSHDYITGSEVHIVCVTPFCIELKSLFDFIDNGSLLVPETSSDALVNPHATFIASWSNIVGIPSAAVLNSEGILTFESIASQIHAASISVANPLTTWFSLFSGGVEDTGVDETEATWNPYYIGLPKLVINDGSPNWWNSPDIWVTNSIHSTEGNAYYEAGANNDIHVRVYNEGCHPLTRFSVGSTLFPYGGGGTPGKVNPSPKIIGSTMVQIGDSHEYSYSELFDEPLGHRCIKGRASLQEITDAEIDDDSEWAPTTREYEAQKNLNPAPVAPPPSPAPTPEPGGGEIPEPDPGEEPEPDNEGERSVENLRSYREEEILIANPFKEKRRFRIVMAENIKEYSKIIDLQFFTFNGKSPAKIYPFDTKRKRFPRATFTLLPGQELNLMAYIGLRKGVKEIKPIPVSMEILVERRKNDRFFRKPEFCGFKDRFSSFAGVTLLVETSSVDLRLLVLDRKKSPVKGAKVHLTTPNGRQAAILVTDGKGFVHFKGINPGPYYATAIGLKEKSARIIINAYPGRKISEPHMLVLGKS